jgi:hypothetical protein
MMMMIPKNNGNDKREEGDFLSVYAKRREWMQDKQCFSLLQLVI